MILSWIIGFCNLVQINVRQWEREFLQRQSVNIDMKFASFVEVYFEDKALRLKERSIMTKRILFEIKIIPYFGEKQMNEITPVDIIKWQNTLLNQDYNFENGMSSIPKTYYWRTESFRLQTEKSKRR